MRKIALSFWREYEISGVSGGIGTRTVKLVVFCDLAYMRACMLHNDAFISCDYTCACMKPIAD